jgi:hypothetical protein
VQGDAGAGLGYRGAAAAGRLAGGGGGRSIPRPKLRLHFSQIDEIVCTFSSTKQ